jgi:CHAT domain-containing protein
MPRRVITVLSAGLIALAAATGALAQTAPDVAGLTAAAERGDLGSMEMLGDRLHAGDGVGIDRAAAYDWYDRAVEEGSAYAAYRLGLILDERDGPGDQERSAEMLRLSAERYRAAEGADSRNAALVEALAIRVAVDLMRNEEALAIADRATPILRKNGDEPTLALALQNAGMAKQKLEQHEEALTLFAGARAVYEKLIRDSAQPRSIVLDIGDTYLNAGISFEGRSLFDEALYAYGFAAGLYESFEAQTPDEIAKRDFSLGAVLNNKAWVLSRMKRHQEAYDTFEMALPPLERTMGPAHSITAKVIGNLGIVAQAMGRSEEAIRLSLRALAILNRDREATLDDQRWVYEALSKAFADRGDRRRAILFGKLAVNAHQAIRGRNRGTASKATNALDAEWRRLYTRLADALVEDGRPSEAQAVLNLLKERELFEFVERDAAIVAGAPIALGARESAVAKSFEGLVARPLQLAALEQDLFAAAKARPLSAEETATLARAKAELEAIDRAAIEAVDALLAEADAAAASSGLASMNLEATDVYANMLEELGGEAVLLQIAAGEDSLSIFLTTRALTIHRRVPVTRSVLSREVFDALEAVERRRPDAVEKLGRLYERLVRPVAADLADSGAKVVMLNLDGFLRYVPFAALNDRGRFLVEDYALSWYTPAANTRFDAPRRDAASAAGFGVTRAHPGFRALPAVGAELDAIFGADPGAPLRGQAFVDDAFDLAALESAIRARPTLLHIASHFRFVPGSEDDSVLLLGTGEALSLETFRKSRNFRLRGLDLLTLSACETAQGSEGEGEEVESFGAIAQLGGAAAVMATLWPIEDQATASLMPRFYAKLIGEGLDKAQALRAAQIEAIRSARAPGADAVRGPEDDAPAIAGAVDGAHPYYWAPFILMGNWR